MVDIESAGINQCKPISNIEHPSGKASLAHINVSAACQRVTLNPEDWKTRDGARFSQLTFELHFKSASAELDQSAHTTGADSHYAQVSRISAPLSPLDHGLLRVGSRLLGRFLGLQDCTGFIHSSGELFTSLLHHRSLALIPIVAFVIILLPFRAWRILTQRHFIFLIAIMT
ncbi:hypothetical protein KEM48_003057 [Puccinia striiformis f. sp. tritici PST-130]|nr:hypothetical protein KEM48_003057 [Puccinia striiformis f. sp. tritici PST-130]